MSWGEYGRGLSRSQRWTWIVARILMVGAAKMWFRYEVIGRENLPTSGPFILCPVHRSNLDTPLLPVLRSAPIRFMGKDSLWEASRFASWFLTTLGGFPVDRDGADRAAMRSAEEILEQGATLVMFPEGTRRSGPIVQSDNMFEGPSFIAGRKQCPIVPVGIGGSERAMPIGSKLVYPRKIVFVIGEPMDPPTPNENGRVTRAATKQHTEELRQRLQQLFDEAQLLVGTSARHRS